MKSKDPSAKLLAALNELADVAPDAKSNSGRLRLSEETWAIILKEYLAGATVPQLAEKWGVAGPTIRNRIWKNDASKAAWGDTIARDRADAQDEVHRIRKVALELKRRRLFIDCTLDDVVDPHSLAFMAIVASGRAMTAQMWTEARALTCLAEAYTRLHERHPHWVTTEQVMDLAVDGEEPTPPEP